MIILTLLKLGKKSNLWEKIKSSFDNNINGTNLTYYFTKKKKKKKRNY